MEKKIELITPRTFKHVAPGFKTVDIMHSEYNIEPFLVFTEYHMEQAVFGPHPHAGVSVMTYMMPDSEGSFLNKDSLGDRSIIEPGGVHVSQSGTGMKHDEVPYVPGTDCHGFQIWINHSDANRLVTPRSFHAGASEIPVVVKDGYSVRVIQGQFLGQSSPINLLTKTQLYNITLEANSKVTLDAEEMAFIYLMEGTIHINGESIDNRSFIKFGSDGNSVTVTAGDKKTNFMYASGTPHNEPIVYGGPFVMTTEEQMLETKRRNARGEMGEIK
jgi:quercetin 2,3-dioxygenase